ncbi:MAG: glycosyltransferase family 39 protein [Gemmataceae bacterium]|nr:glycosyltransferase family 39 protein [Gemmataceae bacterium]
MIPRPKDGSRSLPAGLRDLWSHVLFPGQADPSASVRPVAVLLLLLLPGLLLYPCLSFYLFEPDEGRYAEIPREMLARGEWVVPYLQDQPYLDKPPLLYWLVMVSYSVLGVHDWAARLVPALAVHASILLLYWLGRLSLGERSAFWGALLLTLSPLAVGVGRLLVLDGLLALWVTLALLSAFEAVRGSVLLRRWWLVSALACGLGVLTKGPVILILVLPPLWLYRRLNRDGAALNWKDRLAWAGVVLGVALPWYAAVCLSVPEFAQHFLWEHNVVRFVDPFDHQEPVWFYIPLLLLGLLPGVLLLVPFLRFLGTGDAGAAEGRPPALGFVLVAGLWCVLFFSLSGCKLPTYLLPAFPPLALALGHFVAHGRTPPPTPSPARRGAESPSGSPSPGRGGGWGERFPRRLGALIALGLTLQAAGHYLVVPWYARYRSPLDHWQALTTACADPDTPVVCYPRAAHSVAFYLGRADLPNYRSKEMHTLCGRLRERPRTVVLLTHRHSLLGLSQALPPDLKVVESVRFNLTAPEWLPESMGPAAVRALGETALGLCDLAVVERSSSRLD